MIPNTSISQAAVVSCALGFYFFFFKCFRVLTIWSLKLSYIWICRLLTFCTFDVRLIQYKSETRLTNIAFLGEVCDIRVTSYICSGMHSGLIFTCSLHNSSRRSSWLRTKFYSSSTFTKGSVSARYPFLWHVFLEKSFSLKIGFWMSNVWLFVFGKHDLQFGIGYEGTARLRKLLSHLIAFLKILRGFWQL